MQCFIKKNLDIRILFFSHFAVIKCCKNPRVVLILEYSNNETFVNSRKSSDGSHTARDTHTHTHERRGRRETHACVFVIPSWRWIDPSSRKRERERGLQGTRRFTRKISSKNLFRRRRRRRRRKAFWWNSRREVVEEEEEKEGEEKEA